MEGEQSTNELTTQYSFLLPSACNVVRGVLSGSQFYEFSEVVNTMWCIIWNFKNQNTGNFQGYHEMKLVWVKNLLNGKNAFLKAILKCKLSFARRSCNEIFSIASVLPCAQFRHLSKRMGSIVAQLVIVSTKKQFDLQPVHF